MRRLFKAVYYWLAGPLYRRLHHETEVELARMNRLYLEYHERLTSHVADELGRVHLHLGAVKDELVKAA